MDANKLIAAGAPIVLADGITRNLRYGMRGLARLEEDFGSLQGMQAAMKEIEDWQNAEEEERRTRGVKIFSPLAKILAAGLVTPQLSYDDALDLLDPAKLNEYVQPMQQALSEAFPQVAQVEDVAVRDQVAELMAMPSPGPIGTTSQPLAMAGTMRSSGL